MSALPLALPGMVAAGVDAKRGLGKGAAEKSCIFILLCGGDVFEQYRDALTGFLHACG